MASPSSTPALAPPPGEMTDFGSPDILWKWNVLCQTACLSLTGVMFILRTYIRLWVKRVWILEDYMCCLAFASLAIYSALLTTIIAKHGGTHQWDLRKSEVITILYYVNIIQIWYGPAAAFTKSAILMLYLRIFSPYRWTKFAITIRLFIAIICGFYFAISIAKICQCLPRGRIWDHTVPGNCVNLSALLGISGMFNIISDICILLVPLKGVWRLQMSRKKKMGIYVIFTLGAVAPVFSIVGTVVRIRLTANPDQSYNSPIVLLWATAELTVGVMIICLPTLPGIVHGRATKPSSSIIDGSAKLHERKLYGHNPHAGRDYYELAEERRPEHAHLKHPQSQSALINEIRGAEEEDFRAGGLGLERENDVPPGGIVKTTWIERSSV